MKETSQNAVPLPAALSSHVLVVFEYLHGKFELPKDSEPELVIGVYELSKQYHLVDLQRELLEVLPSIFSSANIGPFLMFADQIMAPEVVKLALDFFSAMPPAKDMFLHLDDQEALIKGLRESSLTSKLNSQTASCFLDAILEWGRTRLMGSSEEPCCSSAEGSSSSSASTAFREKLGEVLAPVLAVIKFERQPILDLVEEREDVVSLLPLQRQLEVYKALPSHVRRTAKRARVAYARTVCPWDPQHCGIGLTVERRQDGRDTIRKNNIGYSSARGTHCFEDGVHEWELRVGSREGGGSPVWVGLAGDGSRMDSWLGKQEAGWMVCIGRGLKCHAAQRLPDNANPPFANFGPESRKYEAQSYGPSARQEGEQSVVMTVDMVEHTLSFKINGTDYGVAFSDLPSGPLYPAVSLANGAKGSFIGYRGIVD